MQILTLFVARHNLDECHNGLIIYSQPLLHMHMHTQRASRVTVLANMSLAMKSLSSRIKLLGVNRRDK